MTVVLTGGTGLVGSAVLSALVAAGQDVTAIVRSEDSATKVSEAGAKPVRGDLTDVAWLTAQFAATDGAIHTASPGDASSADFDSAVAQAALAAFAGSGKTYVHTGGVWVHGAGTDITEDTPLDPPQLTAWRKSVEDLVLGGDFRAVVIEPGIVYGRGGEGLAQLVAHPNDAGEFRLIGDGSQHWTTVGAEELADLYVRAYENPRARGYYVGVNDGHPTVREIVTAVAGDIAVVAESAEQSRGRLFPPLVDALLLDQIASSAKARHELGWDPTGPSLVDVLSH